jgi:transposase
LKREFWRLIATGMQSDAASRKLGLTRTTGIRWFGEAGGVPPIDLAEPSARFLSISEREEIAVLRGHVSAREIARRLHRAPSTIVRELRRNTPRDGQYRALLAQKHADHRSARPKPSKLAASEQLGAYVQEKIGGPERWSPEQISRRLRRIGAF